jgi:hypothetical protein
VKAGKMRVPKRGDTVEPCAGHIAFGARGFASEHLAMNRTRLFQSLAIRFV